MNKRVGWMVACGMALAAQAAAAKPERANGAVVADGEGVTLSFTASGTPESASGSVSYSWTGGVDFTGTVQCYDQTDNSAGFSGSIDSGPYTGTYFFIEVLDNGEGAKAAPDRFRVQTFGSMYDCTQRSNSYPAIVTSGNLVVH